MRRTDRLLGLSLILCLGSLVTLASAHERERGAPTASGASQTLPLWIQIASDAEGPEASLQRRFTVGLFRVSNGQPLVAARVELLADMRTMPGVHKVPSVLLSAGREPGTYAGAVRLPMAGPWLFRIKVSGPVTGVLDFVDRVGEGGAGLFTTASSTALRLQDSLNLAARGFHFLGAALWLGGFAMLAMLAGRGGGFPAGLASLRTVAFWQAGGLALLLVTGVYNLLYNAPTGRLITRDDLLDMLAQPYGFPYAGLLLYKLGVVLLLLGLGLWALRRWRQLPTLTWLRLNLALGLLVVLLGGALSFLHVFIHSRPGF